MSNELGKLAFEAYSKAMGGKTFDGRPIPQWEELGEAVQNGWMTAADAVTDYWHHYWKVTENDE